MGTHKKPYAYKMCGLDYVFLRNGYNEHDTEYGAGVSIDNVDELHTVIGRAIVDHLPELTGKEVRFIRSEMSMSQKQLTEFLGIEEQAVHRWETGKTKKVNPQSDRLIRLIYKRFLKQDPDIVALCESLKEMQRTHNRDKLQEMEFALTSHGWESVACLAA